MTATAATLKDVAAEWRAARRVYTVYAAVLRRFDLGVSPCKELESPIDRADAECVKAMRQWLEQMDVLTDIVQLRQVLQTESLGTEQNLRALLHRYLNVNDEVEQYRDKVDYLLVQYFSQVAPDEMHTRTVRLEDMARVLEPVIGEASLRLPSFMGALEMLLVRLSQCATLGDVLREGILAQGRAIKVQAGPMYFGSGVLLAFTRYNFLVRRSFMRLLQEDLKRINAMLNELEARDVTVVDCRKTEFACEEPIADLRRVVRDWRSIYRADYQAGHSFQLIADLRKVLEGALAASPPKKVQIVVEEEELGPDDHLAMVDSQAAPPVNDEIEAAAIESAPAMEEHAAKVLQSLRAPEPVAVNVQAALETIAGQLFSGELLKQHLPISTVTLGKSDVLLSSWEVAAFIKGGDDLSDTLQRTVAIRALLTESLRRALEMKETKELISMLAIAHAEAAVLQECIAQSRDAKNVDAAVNLAASGKRLTSLMDEAEKLVAGERSN